MCRLQTFPDGLKFDCSRNEIQKMLGNAVPSLVAERLAYEIRQQLLGERRRKRVPRLIPPARTPPPPEKVRQVPKKYFDRIGDHPDHPGEGKGVGALRRTAKQHRPPELDLRSEAVIDAMVPD
jgi:DNA (cytosine-5)-methyltransferase 1